MPQISVVIPVYNGERTIRDAVRSVLEQTLPDFELIVIDDGSQDSTRSILAAIDDPRLKVFSFPNAGLSASRNRGIDLASADYIAFLDADDLWTADKLEAQLTALRQRPEAAVCYSWTDFVDAGGTPLGYGIHHTREGYVFPELLMFFFIGSGSNAMVQKSAFDKAGRFDESLTAAEDWDMCLRLAANYPFVAVPRVQVLYRVVEDSMSSNVRRQEAEMLKVLERAYAQEPGRSLQHLQRETYANMYLYLAGRALRGAPGRREAFEAARFLGRAFGSGRGVLKRANYVLILCGKALIAVLLPRELGRASRAWAKSVQRRWR